MKTSLCHRKVSKYDGTVHRTLASELGLSLAGGSLVSSASRVYSRRSNLSSNREPTYTPGNPIKIYLWDSRFSRHRYMVPVKKLHFDNEEASAENSELMRSIAQMNKEYNQREAAAAAVERGLDSKAANKGVQSPLSGREPSIADSGIGSETETEVTREPVESQSPAPASPDAFWALVDRTKIGRNEVMRNLQDNYQAALRNKLKNKQSHWQLGDYYDPAADEDARSIRRSSGCGTGSRSQLMDFDNESLDNLLSVDEPYQMNLAEAFGYMNDKVLPAVLRQLGKVPDKMLNSLGVVFRRSSQLGSLIEPKCAPHGHKFVKGKMDLTGTNDKSYIFQFYSDYKEDLNEHVKKILRNCMKRKRLNKIGKLIRKIVPMKSRVKKGIADIMTDAGDAETLVDAQEKSPMMQRKKIESDAPKKRRTLWGKTPYEEKVVTDRRGDIVQGAKDKTFLPDDLKTFIRDEVPVNLQERYAAVYFKKLQKQLGLDSYEAVLEHYQLTAGEDDTKSEMMMKVKDGIREEERLKAETSEPVSWRKNRTVELRLKKSRERKIALKKKSREPRSTS